LLIIFYLVAAKCFFYILSEMLLHLVMLFLLGKKMKFYTVATFYFPWKVEKVFFITRQGEGENFK